LSGALVFILGYFTAPYTNCRIIIIVIVIFFQYKGGYDRKSVQSAAGKLSCNKTALKRCTKTEILWNKYYYYYYILILV